MSSDSTRRFGENTNPCQMFQVASRAALDAGFRRHDRRLRSTDNFRVEVSPRWVVGLDQIELPRSRPFLDGFFTGDGGFHGFVQLVPDEQMDTVFLGEAIDLVGPVLPDSLNKVGCNASVERAVSFAGEKIHARLFHQHSLLDSGFRRNDGLCYLPRTDHPRHTGERRYPEHPLPLPKATLLYSTRPTPPAPPATFPLSEGTIDE